MSAVASTVPQSVSISADTITTIEGADANSSDPPSSAEEAVPTHCVADLLNGKDLQSFSLKQMRSELEQIFGYHVGSLSDHPYKQRIKELATAEVERRMAPPPPPAEVPRTPPAGRLVELSSSDKAKREHEPDVPSGRKAAKVTSGSCPGPMTKRQFVEQAKPLPIDISGHKFALHQRTFSTGSCGYWGQASIPVQIDGHEVMVKCQINAVINTSKGWVDA